MVIKRIGVKLCKDKNLFDSGMDAVGNRNIYDPVSAPKWNSRFCPVFCKREKSFPSSSTKNNANNFTQSDLLAVDNLLHSLLIK
jgi:hypothetical protein